MTKPPSDPAPFSFVVRLWAGRNTPLRGRITRVGVAGRDEQHAVTRLGHIGDFIGEALEREGVSLGSCWKFRRWWLARVDPRVRPKGGEHPSER